MPSDSVRHPTLFTNYLFSLNVKFDYLFLIDKIDWVPFLLSTHIKYVEVISSVKLPNFITQNTKDMLIHVYLHRTDGSNCG